jgi:hypothetical protein
MIGLASYLSFLALLAAITCVALNSRPDRSTVNVASAMLSAARVR